MHEIWREPSNPLCEVHHFLSPLRELITCKMQSHGGSACDGVAVSCDKGILMRRRGMR